MSQEPKPTQPAEADFEKLRQEFANTLLAKESPVANESAFKRDRERHIELLEQHDQIRQEIALLRSAADDVGEAESVATTVEGQLQAERKQLLELAGKLGEAAFAGLQSGAIADAPRFKDRKDLQSRIDDLRRQKSALTMGDATGLVEQASLKVQDLKLLGQIKVEELKISSTNRALGKDILSAKAEDAVRCDTTTETLGTIKNQRLRIAKAKKAVQVAEETLANAKRQAADTLARSEGLDAASLGAQLKRQQAALSSVDAHIENLQEAIVEKALGYEWLRDNPLLREPLARLAELQQQVTPRKLSVWPLASVVISGHLLASFGSQPLNLNALDVLILYVATAIGGLALLAYYKPDLVAGEQRYKSVLLLFIYSIASIVMLFAFQSLAEHAIANWTTTPDWSRNRFGLIVDLPRRLLVTVGQAYQDTFSIMAGSEKPASLLAYFKTHMLSVGLCEELVKLAPALAAFAAFTGSWTSRSREFNSQLVYLAMIGGLAFGLGEAVYYHFTMYAPSKAGWGIYATRFLSLVTIHSVWAGISGWILAHVTGGWIRRAFTTVAQGFGPIIGCGLVALTVVVSDILHTSHNLSSNPLWMLAWDVISLALFAWLVRCSSLSQLIPRDFRRISSWRPRLTSILPSGEAIQQTGVGTVVSSINSRRDIQAGEAENDKSDSQSKADTPELWNPNAAGLWSLLFSPIFGGWLHSKNWKNLGQPDKAKVAWYWVYGSAAFLSVTLFLPFVISNLAYAVLLVAWWMRSGHEQYTYVKEHCPVYRRKRWGTPLSVAGLATFGVVLLSAAVEIDSMSAHEAEKLKGQWALESVADSQQLAIMSESTGVQLQRMTRKGTSVYSQNGKSRHEYEWLISGKERDGSRFTFVFYVTLNGQWSFDGQTINEYVEDAKLAPVDNATKAIVNQSPEVLTSFQQELANQQISLVAIFDGNEKLDLADPELGVVTKLRKLHNE